MSLDDRLKTINSLLTKHLLQIFQRGTTLLYREQSAQVAQKLMGLTSEDWLVYQTIEQSSNKGIWTKELKRVSNLLQPQINKILKTLEGRRLIKAVKSIAGKNRKVYMLAELEPSREITGGVWYTDNELDTDLIEVLRKQCLHYIMQEGQVSLEEVIQYVRSSGVTTSSATELRAEEFTQVLNSLIYDGDVEARTSTGAGKESEFAHGTTYYQVCQNAVPTTSGLTNIPCGICPVLLDCSEDGLVSPNTCTYYQEWLQF